MRPIVAMRSAAAANCEATSAFVDARLCSEQQSMIGLPAQERLLLDQPVLLTKQSLILGESLSQPAFRAPMSYQLAATVRPSRLSKIICESESVLDGEYSMVICRAPPCPDFVSWTLELCGQKSRVTLIQINYVRYRTMILPSGVTGKCRLFNGLKELVCSLLTGLDH